MAQRVSLQDPDRAIECLERDGGVILTGFATVAEIETVNADAAPFIDKVAQERTANGEALGTMRCYRLFGRSEMARERWLQQPGLLKILRYFLRTESRPWNSKDEGSIVTDPILSVAATMVISPGEKSQQLHRDDFLWHQVHTTSPEKYEVGRDVSMGMVVAGVETTFENGGTLYVKGSHLWDHTRRPKPEEVACAELAVGEAFMYFGSTAHGGGENITTHSRIVHGFFYCRSYLRPEENQFLWWTKEEIDKWSDAAKHQAGYLLDSSFLGHCDETHPLNRFRTSSTTQGVCQ